VLYELKGRDAIWHQRYLLGGVAPSATKDLKAKSLLAHVVCLDPDGDLEIEDLSMENGEIQAVRMADERKDLPVGIVRGETYRFRTDPTVRSIESALEKADVSILAHLKGVYKKEKADTSGLVKDDLFVEWTFSGQAAPAAGAPAAARAKPGGAAPLFDPTVVATKEPEWIFVESTAAGRRGERLDVSDKAKTEGDIGMDLRKEGWTLVRRLDPKDLDAYLSLEDAVDLRLLTLPKLVGDLTVLRPWREVVAAMKEDLKIPGWPIAGPRTVLWCCQFIDRRQGGPIEHVRWFQSIHGLSKESWGISEYESSMRALHYLAGWDAVNVCNSAGVEVLMRKAQLTEYVYLMDRESEAGENKADGDGKKKQGKNRGKGMLQFSFVDESAAFTGTAKEFGDIMVAPSLLTHVSAEVERDANVLKQIRKAREERRALRA